MKASSYIVVLLGAASACASPLLETRKNGKSSQDELVVDLGDAGRYKGTYLANGTVKSWRGTSALACVSSLSLNVAQRFPTRRHLLGTPCYCCDGHKLTESVQ